jgi:hypothetical protein
MVNRQQTGRRTVNQDTATVPERGQLFWVFQLFDIFWTMAENHENLVCDTKLTWKLTLIKYSRAISHVKWLKFSDVSGTTCVHHQGCNITVFRYTGGMFWTQLHHNVDNRSLKRRRILTI